MRSGAFDADDIEAAPSVIGPEHLDENNNEPSGDEQQLGKTIVYLPVAAPMGEGQENVTVQLRNTDAGELALPVFSGLDALVANCGEDQAWISVTTGDLDDIVTQSDADSVLVDPAMPDSEQDEGEDA